MSSSWPGPRAVACHTLAPHQTLQGRRPTDCTRRATASPHFGVSVRPILTAWRWWSVLGLSLPFTVTRARVAAALWPTAPSAPRSLSKAQQKDHFLPLSRVECVAVATEDGTARRPLYHPGSRSTRHTCTSIGMGGRLQEGTRSVCSGSNPTSGTPRAEGVWVRHFALAHPACRFGGSQTTANDADGGQDEGAEAWATN